MVVFPFKDRSQQSAALRNWDLWGPMIFTLGLATTLSLGAQTASKTFSVGAWVARGRMPCTHACCGKGGGSSVPAGAGVGVLMFSLAVAVAGLGAHRSKFRRFDGQPFAGLPSRPLPAAPR